MTLYEELKLLIEQYEKDMDHKKPKVPMFVFNLSLKHGHDLSYVSNLVSGLFPNCPPREVEELLEREKGLFKKIVKLKLKLKNLVSGHIQPELLSGATIQEHKLEMNESGLVNRKIITRRLPNKVVEKMLIFDPVDKDEAYISHEDIAVISRTKGFKTISDIIPEYEINRAVESMMDYQFKMYKDIERDIFKTDKFNVHHVFKGGFQSGKTTAVTVIVGKLLNLINKTNQPGHATVTFMGANLNAIHTNIVKRLCSAFPSLKGKEPPQNSIIWNISDDFAIRLVSTSNKHFDTLKGSTINFCYIDELDAITPDMLNLLISRLSIGCNIEDSNGKKYEKNILLATMNPRDPLHHVSQYIHNEATGITLHEVSTACNTTVSQDYHRQLIASNGGVGTQRYQRYYEGKTVSISTAYNVFVIRPEIFRNILGAMELEENQILHEIHIGADFGCATQTCFVAVAVVNRQSDGKSMIRVLSELVFDYGEWNDIERFAKLIKMKNFFLKIGKLCVKAYIYIPHDSGAQELRSMCKEIISSDALSMYDIRSAIMIPVEDAIGKMRALINLGLLEIDCTCKNLERQLYAYSYNAKFIERETSDVKEMILKKDDHSIDAMKYAVLPIIDKIIEIKDER